MRQRGRQEPSAAQPVRPEEPPRFLITAQEAFPVLEERFLAARSHIRMGFRIFDPLTPLYSQAGREVGRDWFDLLVHTLAPRRDGSTWRCATSTPWSPAGCTASPGGRSAS